MRVLTGTWLYIILFSSAYSKNKPRSFSLSFFLFLNIFWKIKQIFCRNVLNFVFWCLNLKSNLLFYLFDVRNHFCFNASIFFRILLFVFFNSTTLTENSRWCWCFWLLLRMAFWILFISRVIAFIFSKFLSKSASHILIPLFITAVVVFSLICLLKEELCSIYKE